MRLASLVAATAAFFLVTPAFALGDVTPLVNAEWLKAHAADENVVVIDIRDRIAETDLGNLPYLAHAVVAPYASYGWRTEIDGVPGQIPADADIARLIGNLGVEGDDHVVIVPWGTDSSEFAGATRVYWTFKYLGHDAVSILDGGWRQYDAQGGERVAAPVVPVAVNFPYSVRKALRGTTEDVLAALEDGTTLIDARPYEQHVGNSRSPIVRVNGTIPGALNIEHSALYSAEYASFVTPETLVALAQGVGLGADESNIVFCNTGHWASIAWFALSEVAGNKNTAMYDGSMVEWAADPARPVQ